MLNNSKCHTQGTGETRRNFIHVNDTVSAVKSILLKGEIGETYNIGTSNEYSVNEIYAILMQKLKPEESLDDWKVQVADRNFNDRRYNVDPSKLKELGWEEKVDFNTGLDEVIEWYKQNSEIYLSLFKTEL